MGQPQYCIRHICYHQKYGDLYGKKRKYRFGNINKIPVGNSACNIKTDSHGRCAVSNRQIYCHDQPEMHHINIVSIQHGQKNRPQDERGGDNIHKHAHNQKQYVHGKKKYNRRVNTYKYGFGYFTGNILKGKITAETGGSCNDDEQGGGSHGGTDRYAFYIF